MRPLLVWALVIAAWPACAGTVNVSRDMGVTIGFGDRLEVAFLSSYASPAGISFSLITVPNDVAGPAFNVSLQSADGSVTMALEGATVFAPGSMRSSGYAGPVSVASGRFSLTDEQSLALFGKDGRAALLLLEYMGGALDLRLPGYTLSRMFMIATSNRTSTTGAQIQRVSLESAPQFIEMPESLLEGGSPVPEPAAAGLALLGLIACYIRRALSGNTRRTS